MAKFYGVIGFIKTIETEPGIWTNQPTERPYFGELVRNISKFQTAAGVNDNISTSNEISIIADPYANENFQHIRYVEFMGARWKVTAVEVKHPRIILTVGGVYNGEQAKIAGEP